MHTIAIILLVIGALGAYALTVAPLVPGAVLVPVSVLVAALVDDRLGRVHWWFWVLQIVLVIVYVLIDNVVQTIGVGKAGASKPAMWGGAIGVCVGPLVLVPISGPFALLLGAPVGATLGTVGGELWHRRGTEQPHLERGKHVARLGWISLVGWLVGTWLKLGVVSIQVVAVIIVWW